MELNLLGARLLVRSLLFIRMATCLRRPIHHVHYNHVPTFHHVPPFRVKLRGMDPRHNAALFVWLYLSSYVCISVPLGVYWAGLGLGWW